MSRWYNFVRRTGSRWEVRLCLRVISIVSRASGTRVLSCLVECVVSLLLTRVAIDVDGGVAILPLYCRSKITRVVYFYLSLLVWSKACPRASKRVVLKYIAVNNMIVAGWVVKDIGNRFQWLGNVIYCAGVKYTKHDQREVTQWRRESGGDVSAHGGGFLEWQALLVVALK